MKKIFITLLLLLAACEVFGQGAPSGSLFRRVSDTAISKTNNMRVPVYLQVGDINDPLSGWNKGQLVALKIEDTTKGNIAGTFWIQIDSAGVGHHTTHALFSETYSHQGDSANIDYYSMVAEFSFNVAGKIVDDGTNTKYLYNTIFNGFAPKVNGSDTGLIVAPNVIYVDINPLDVVSGLFGKCQIDTVYGLRIQQQDNGAIVTYSIWAGDNIHSDDTISTKDALMIGREGSDTAWVKPDSLLGVNTIAPDSNEVLTLDSRTKGAGYNQNIIRMRNDSVQFRMLYADGFVTFQFGDSNMVATRSLLIAGNSNVPLMDLELRANWITIQNLDASKYRLPRTPGTNGQVLTLATISGTDTTYWGSAGGGTVWPLADSLQRVLDSVDVYYISEAGDTIAGSAKIFDFGGNYIFVTYLETYGSINIGGSLYFDSLSATSNITKGRPGAFTSTGKLLLQQDATGGIGFYYGGTESIRHTGDTLSGLNRSWLKYWPRCDVGYIEADSVETPLVRTTDIIGIDTSGPVTLYSELDMNGYSITNADSVEANRLSGDTVRASVWEGLPDSLAGINEIKPVINDSLDIVRAEIHDSLVNPVHYKYIESQPYSWDRPLADSVVVLYNRLLHKDSDSAKAILVIDSCKDITPSKNDTLLFVVAFEDSVSIDTIGLEYICSNANNYITSIDYAIGRNGNAGNFADSIVTAGYTATTDRDFTTWTYLPLDNTDLVLTKGKRFGVRIIVTHAADNGAVKIAWIRLAYRKR